MKEIWMDLFFIDCHRSKALFIYDLYLDQIESKGLFNKKVE